MLSKDEVLGWSDSITTSITFFRDMYGTPHLSSLASITKLGLHKQSIQLFAAMNPHCCSQGRKTDNLLPKSSHTWQ